VETWRKWGLLLSIKGRLLLLKGPEETEGGPGRPRFGKRNEVKSIGGKRRCHRGKQGERRGGVRRRGGDAILNARSLFGKKGTRTPRENDGETAAGGGVGKFWGLWPKPGTAWW